MTSTFAPKPAQIERRLAGGNVWLHHAGADEQTELMKHSPQLLNYEVLESEAAVGRAMFAELVSVADGKEGDLTVVILRWRECAWTMRSVSCAISSDCWVNHSSGRSRASPRCEPTPPISKRD